MLNVPYIHLLNGQIDQKCIYAYSKYACNNLDDEGVAVILILNRFQSFQISL